MPPRSEGLLESSLYVDDVDRSARFYGTIFGFQVISDFGERGCAMQAGSRQVLLLFKKGASRAIQSPHDGDGELHIAFAISRSSAGLIGSIAIGGTLKQRQKKAAFRRGQGHPTQTFLIP